MNWIRQESGWRIPIKSWCRDLEPAALQQAANLAMHPALFHHVALMPDCHCGIGMPIGGVIAADNALIPSAVGVDIGCGMVAAETDLPADCFQDIRIRRKLLENLKCRIPVGEGRSHATAQDWDGFTRYADEGGNTALWPTTLDRRNLGTLGGGNHFIELQQSDDREIWLMLHSGSRNLGHRVECHYQALALDFAERNGIRLADPQLAYLSWDSEGGRNYYRDMQFALDYAMENRRRMMRTFREALQELFPRTEFRREVNIHHNYAALETHFDAECLIHRKGATSARLNETGIIPGSMGTASYMVRGLGNPESFMSCSHGAGRVMSRTQACKTLTPEECDRAMNGIAYDRWKPFSAGRRKQLHGMLDLSEAPQSYKPIGDVIAAQLDLVEPLVRLTPLAVLKG
jgi:tRNA-splicing ligase RtcB